MQRIWKYKLSQVREIPPALIEAAEGQPILAKLLAVRGITDPEKARLFLNPASYTPTDASAFEDMEKAVDRILKAIDDKEPILVYGDFDVDGITGTSILMETLKTLDAQVSFYIPHRHTEGHGLNTTALCRLVSSRQIKVVITTDTGITNFNEVNLINGLKVDTIITDHHELPENLPLAYAILNPKLLPPTSPLADLCGAGVAYKLSEALLQSRGASQKAIDALLDLTAIGTVVDMVPLVQENRYLVWRGLEVLNRRQRPGIKAILEEAGIPESAALNTQTLGFVLGPRLNAVGRLSDASEAVTLLTSQDTETVKQLASKLEHFNRQRKELVEQCLLQAESHLINTGELTGQKAIIIANPGWNPGVVGLVATKLVEKYNRPCFVGYVEEDAEEVRFSARSIESFNMHENLRELEALFIRWGGHSGAAGFAVSKKNFPTLKQRLFTVCNQRIQDDHLLPVTTVDMALSFSQVNPHLINLVEKMAPFGQENPMPVFALEGVSLGAQKLMGEDKRHLKLILAGQEPGSYLEAIQWNWGSQRELLNPKSTYRLAFTAELNTYNGSTKVQLLLKDIVDEAQLQPLAPVTVSTAMESKPATVNTPSAEPALSLPTVSSDATDNGIIWVDHRKRTELESFLSQTLSEMTETQKETRIFCEGTQRFFPLPLSEDVFCGRYGKDEKKPIESLLLWDLPANMSILIQLLKRHRPGVIHLVGGKYHSIPLYRPPQEFLEGFLKVLQRQARQANANVVSVSLPHLTSMLSTAPMVLITGLGLLNRLGYTETLVNQETQEVKITLLTDSKKFSANLTELIEYTTFKNALDEVYQFREWLITAPADVIKSVVALEMLSGQTVLREERERHVTHLR